MSDYFTKNTDIAIEKFLSSDDPKVKNEIFDKEIRPAFEKLVESLIHVYKFYNLDSDIKTLQCECMTNLYEMLPKFDPKKGTKGFSYFNVVARNWFIHKTRERSRKLKVESELHVDAEHESIRNDPSFMMSSHEDVLEEKEKWIKFYEAMDSWKDKLTKKTERDVLGAIIFLMKNPEHVTIFNKKAVYLYLREMTDLNSKQIVVNLKKIKGLYDEWHEKYYSEGEVE